MHRYAALLAGRQSITTSSAIVSKAGTFSTGEVGRVRQPAQAGVELLVDTCSYIAPMLRNAAGPVMTDSGKWAYYAPGNIGAVVVFGSTEECVESAVAGRVVRDDGCGAPHDDGRRNGPGSGRAAQPVGRHGSGDRHGHRPAPPAAGEYWPGGSSSCRPDEARRRAHRFWPRPCAGTAPAAIVLGEGDLILAVGAAVAEELYGIEVPVVVVGPDSWLTPPGATVTVDAEGTVTVGP